MVIFKYHNVTSIDLMTLCQLRRIYMHECQETAKEYSQTGRCEKKGKAFPLQAYGAQRGLGG
jgi:hypothetical protein